MTIRPGEFWVADIAFTQGTGSKKRPVLILWLDGADVVAVAVTFALPRTPTDVALTDWKASGLRQSSTVRLSRLDCLEQSLFLAKIGRISAVYGDRVKQIWDAHIKPQF